MTDPRSAYLAVYGTLRPGEENHWMVRNIEGDWLAGRVHGWTYTIGWGPAEGHPGLTLSPEGSTVDVAVLRSDRLERHWREIDDFEGPGYRRVETEVSLDTGTDSTSVMSWIYETVTDGE